MENRREILCVDILNQFRLNNEEKEDPDAAIRRVSEEIKRFVKLCRRKYEIIGFIDHGITTKETDDKWEVRRIEELKDGRRNCLLNVQTILGEIFQSVGVPIHYSTVDCDDTIAAFAYHMNGSVLSKDSDFFRYYVDIRDYEEMRPPYRIYSGFKMDKKGGNFSLKKHGGLRHDKIRYRASPVKIPDTFPKTRDNTYSLPEIPDFIEKPAGVDLMYVSGCGSNLTQEPNPNLVARPLRQALYSRMDYGPVLERLAHWDPITGATFIKEVVEPDNTLHHLLDNPKKAFKKIFGESINKMKPEYTEEEWRTHVFCQKSAIAKLCAWANPSRGYLNILGEI